MKKKAYFEITNICNLSCSFCHLTRRPPRSVSVSEFRHVLGQLQGRVDFLYFHLMGEPLLHPDLKEFFDIAYEYGFKVIITTNGTLLDKKGDILLRAPSLYKVSISLHAYEANQMNMSIDEYLQSCFAFADRASERGILSVFRLWNKNGKETLNEHILFRMHEYFDKDNVGFSECYSGYKIRDRVFLEWGEKFDWPDKSAEYISDNISCYGMRDQFGILSDGTVVPCCLDAEGEIALGNIFTTPIADILSCQRAQNIKHAFEQRRAVEPLCQSCGYAHKKSGVPAP